MERWAANTLRTLGIILTAGFVLLLSAFLLLLAMCASQGGFGGAKHPEQVVPYVAGAVVVLILGVWFIVWLARGISRSMAIPAPAVAGVIPAGIPSAESVEPNQPVPLHLSPQGRKAIDRLVFALGAQIALSAVAWIIDQVALLRTPRIAMPNHWTVILLGTYVLYHVPYAILIYVLLRRPDRRAFTYSIAVPAVLILQSLFSLSIYIRYLAHYRAAFLMLFLPWAVHILILVLATRQFSKSDFIPNLLP